MIEDFIIIGAGLSGLNIANEIKKFTSKKLLVIDKSRGIGGRMATRRTLNTKFDHGAQFYKRRDEISLLHQHWSEKLLNHKWFEDKNFDHWCAKSGMTALPKSMTESIEILLEKQIRTVDFNNNLWKLISDTGEEWFCKNLIITSPLPQTIKLLEEIEQRNLLDKEAWSELKQISYSMALVGLITLDEDKAFGSSGYLEFQTGDFFSIADQKAKGLSSIPALTVTMSPTFSKKHFDQPDESSLQIILDALKTQFPDIKIKEAELKNWRYCRPNFTYKNYFSEIAPGLFLIGDAFGGASLSGAMRSSNALSHFLHKN